MGNDGGSIPTRRELVKEAARNPTTSELKESRQEQQQHHWTTDPISQKPLARPVVSDSNGKLYNKDTILEYLVEGTRKEEAEAATAGAITGLKDIVEVKFEIDADASAKTNGNGAREIWKCPVTGDKLGPGSKAVYLVPCGHAFSGAAIKEVSGERCVTCDTEYASNDAIPILPTAETDIARLSLRAKTLRERGLTHSLKKTSGGKKRKKRDVAAAEDGTETANGSKGQDLKNEAERASTPVNGDIAKNGSGGINNSSAASVTAKVKQDQELSKKRKTDSENVRSLFSNRDLAKSTGNSADFMTRGYSVGAGGKR